MCKSGKISGEARTKNNFATNKGTARRDSNPEEDKLIAERLFHDEKERSENVMIVDLVRNDLSRTAKKGSVKVEELFGIKTFVQLHQMISTVTSELAEGNNISDLIRTTFPMGSMTGAPKIRAMEIIEVTENPKEGFIREQLAIFHQTETLISMW